MIRNGKIIDATIQFLFKAGSVVKYYWKRVDWDIVKVAFIVGTVPAMLIIGAIFFPLFTSYYGR